MAREIFNDASIKNRYHRLVWVHVGQIFDSTKVFRERLSVFSYYDINEGGSSLILNYDSREILLKKLQEKLKNISYFLVLDDCWNDDAYRRQTFLNSLSVVTGTNGNIIMVTTRSMYVASSVNPIHIHKLGGLSDEDCWSIIKKRFSWEK